MGEIPLKGDSSSIGNDTPLNRVLRVRVGDALEELYGEGVEIDTTSMGSTIQELYQQLFRAQTTIEELTKERNALLNEVEDLKQQVEEAAGYPED